MYLHSKDYSFRYSDADFQDIIRPASLLAVMQESACLSADELGFGYKDLQPKNIGFILSNWYVELYRPLSFNDKLTVKTWPVKPKKLIVFRDFELFLNDEKVGVGTSRWCLVDLATFSLIPSSAIFADINTEYNDFRSIEYNNWKIPEIGHIQPSYIKYVSYSDYDHYNHVNNTKYADLLIDAFSVDELKNKWFSALQISYIKQCKYGEKIEIYKELQDDGFWIVEGRVCGELRVQLKIKLNEI